MRMRITSILGLLVGSAFAKDSFFGNNDNRTNLFKKSDFIVPKVTISVDKTEINNNFYLYFQCEYNSGALNLIKDEQCYAAPWFNPSDVLNKMFSKGLIDKSSITSSRDLKLIQKSDLTVSELEKLITKYTDSSIEKLLNYDNELLPPPSLDISNATMEINFNGEKQTVSNVSLTLGESNASVFSKLSYDVIIKNGNIEGNSYLQFRADTVDPAFIREKIVSDVCAAAGIPTFSANFAELYFNDRYMGLYTMRNFFNADWVRSVFGESNAKNLYACNREYDTCKNVLGGSNDNVENFIKKMNKASSRSELEQFFDVESYMRWQALKYLLGYHSPYGNNNNDEYLYMRYDNSTGKQMWVAIPSLFDYFLGNSGNGSAARKFDKDIKLSNNLYKVLNINEKNSEIIGYIEEYMKTVFDPSLMISRIDDLKKTVDAAVKLDRTPDSNGQLPGRLPRATYRGEDHFTYDNFVRNTEFTYIKYRRYANELNHETNHLLGLKEWVVERFDFVCSTYNVDCSTGKKYLKNLSYKIETDIFEEKFGGCKGTGYPCCNSTSTGPVKDTKRGSFGLEQGAYCLVSGDYCWSLKYGVECCQSKSTKVEELVSRKDNYWFGKENGKRCGVPETQLCPNGGEQYSCCKSTCTPSLSDNTGDWAVENGAWCSIPYTCDKSYANAQPVDVQEVATPTPKKGQCAKGYMPCGGSKYPNAPTCCDDLYYCETSDPTFHQCFPDLSIYEIGNLSTRSFN